MENFGNCKYFSEVGVKGSYERVMKDKVGNID